MSDLESLRCLAHTLNLSVKDITEKEQKLIDLLAKCRSIVGHFKRSSKATQKLKEYQKNLDYDDNPNSPCFKSKDEVWLLNKGKLTCEFNCWIKHVVIQRGDEIRLRIIGLKINASETVGF